MAGDVAPRRRGSSDGRSSQRQMAQVEATRLVDGQSAEEAPTHGMRPVHAMRYDLRPSLNQWHMSVFCRRDNHWTSELSCAIRLQG